MEEHPMKITPLFLQYFGRVPGNGFPFTVWVWCQKYVCGVAGSLLEAFDDFLFSRNIILFRLESIRNINSHFFIRQIFDVSDGRCNVIFVTKILFNGPDFGW